MANNPIKTRAGLNPNIPAGELRKILAVSDNNFRAFAKSEYTSDEALFYKTGFYSPKFNSLSKRDDKDKLVEYRKDNYEGYWQESGWINPTSNRRGVYLSKPRAFCPRDQLPYTTNDSSLDDRLTSTGVYINAIWSGYQEDYDNENYCIAGILRKSIYKQRSNSTFNKNYTIPYRNYFEIFDHSGFQIADISNHRFFRGSGYIPGQPIGYNKIYYQSGLHPSGFLNYKFLYIPNRRITDYDNRLGNVGLNYVSEQDPLNEPHNVPRYFIFFYTGELPIVYLTGGQNVIKKGFGFGPVYQHNNPEYHKLCNSNYRVKFTGIYGESSTTEFSVFNTGNKTERFYIGINNPNILSIEDKKIPGIPMYGVWTFENQSGKNYGQVIDKIYKVGRDANINFKLRINSRGLQPNQTNTTHINIYRITGGHRAFENNVSAVSGDTFPLRHSNQTWYANKKSIPSVVITNTGYKFEKFSIPVDIYPKTNNSSIISDNLLYQDLPSGDYKPSILIGAPININPELDTNHLDINKKIGVTFYSIGSNLKDLSVSLDTKAKVKRKGLEEA